MQSHIYVTDYSGNSCLQKYKWFEAPSLFISQYFSTVWKTCTPIIQRSFFGRGLCRRTVNWPESEVCFSILSRNTQSLWGWYPGSFIQWVFRKQDTNTWNCLLHGYSWHPLLGTLPDLGHSFVVELGQLVKRLYVTFQSCSRLWILLPSFTYMWTMSSATPRIGQGPLSSVRLIRLRLLQPMFGGQNKEGLSGLKDAYGSSITLSVASPELFGKSEFLPLKCFLSIQEKSIIFLSQNELLCSHAHSVLFSEHCSDSCMKDALLPLIPLKRREWCPCSIPQ